MPIIKKVTGDITIFNGNIAHGCNSHGVMGAGVALALRNKFPQIFREYKDYCDRYWGDSVGHIVSVPISASTTIHNCIVQRDFGSRGIKYVSYDAIDTCFKKLNDIYKYSECPNLAIPKIGAGLGGGNWFIIENIINTVTPDINIELWEL